VIVSSSFLGGNISAHRQLLRYKLLAMSTPLV